MGFNDLREFIEKADELGECQTIEGADWETDIGVLTELKSELPDAPLLLFDKIKDYPSGYRVASNLFSTPRRTALGLGLPLEAKGVELVRAFRDWMRKGVKPIPPLEVADGPVKENVYVGDEVDLFKFPVPKWHELDGGRYIGTGSCVIVRDPDEGWVNVGTYRVEVHDKAVATIYMAQGHDGRLIAQKYWKKGQACPVVACCGQEPLLWSAATWEHVAWGVSEYDFAGGLKNEPVKITRGVTTDLPIPATAEIALEGEIVPPEVETREEGPFGEWPGYYVMGTTSQPAFRVKSILHRNNPIIQGNPPSHLPSVWSLGRHYQKAAVLWDELDRQLPGVTGVRMLDEAAMHSIVVISLKQQFDGHAKQAAMVAIGCAATTLCLRFVIVVDDDIDIFNMSQLIWALGTRCEPQDSIDIVRGCRGGKTVPMRSPEQRRLDIVTQSVGVILACKPYHWIEQFPPAVTSSPELRQKTREKWKELFKDTR